MNRLGSKNLFICLNDKVSALPLVQFVETLKVIHPKQVFKVLVDEKQKAMFSNFESDILIFLSKENFANSSPFSNQILCNMKNIDSQMKIIEEMGFDKVFQLGPIQWGRWMLSDLNQKVVTLPQAENGNISSWATMNVLCRFFGVSQEMANVDDRPLFIHPYSDGQIDWHFLARLKEVNPEEYAWMGLAVQESDKSDFAQYDGSWKTTYYRNNNDLIRSGNLIVSFDEKIGSLFSLHGMPSGWITESGTRNDFEGFYPNSFMMTVNSEEFNPQEFITALSYWRSGRLNELAFLNIQSRFQIECIQPIGDGLTLSSVSQNFEEYHLIKKILSVYKEISSTEDQARLSETVMGYLMNYRFEKYLFYSSMKTLKYVVEKMLIANKKSERTFKELSNDFYKISIADEVFESIFGEVSLVHDKNSVFNRLNKLLNFLQTLEYSGESIIEKSLEIS